METFVALDVAIGLAFVYLLLSLICTTVNEWIATIFRLRAATLKRAVRRLVDAPKDEKPAQPEPSAADRLSNKVLTHPLIRSISDSRSTPSYVPAKRFIAALKDVMASDQAGSPANGPERPGTPKEGSSRDISHVQKQLKALRNTDLPTESDTKADDAVIEEWFNEAMDRATGWYKRQLIWITLGVATLITALSNADTLVAARILWQSPTTRAAVVALAQERAKGPRPAESGVIRTARYPDADMPVADPGGAEVKSVGAPADGGQGGGGRGGAGRGAPGGTPAGSPGAGRGTPAPGTAPTERVSEDDDEHDADEETASQGDTALTDAEKAALSQLMGWSREFKEKNGEICAKRQRQINIVCKPGAEASPECRRLLDESIADGICIQGGSGLEPTDKFSASFAGITALALPHLPGWLITIAAISLGAPFWFDTLQRFINIRGGGIKPDTDSAKSTTKRV